MPKDKNRKLVFIAGGIGVTPFRSMIQYLLDTKERRPITLLYSNKTMEDAAYRDVFDRAAELGIKTIYVVTDSQDIPEARFVRRGRIDAAMIQQAVPGFHECTFYLSGPHGLVSAFNSTLKKMGISGRNIKKDYFPGFT